MRKKPVGAISAKALQDRIRTTRAQREEAQMRMFEAQGDFERFDTRLDMLVELLRDLKPESPDATAPKNLTDAAIEYLAAHPGVKAKDVVDALVSSVHTTASNPRKNIHQTILNLRNRGRIEKTPEGGLKVAGNGTAPRP